MTSTVPDHSIRICADRGGTFCDVHALVLVVDAMSMTLIPLLVRIQIPKIPTKDWSWW